MNRVHEIAVIEEQPKIDANLIYEWEVDRDIAFHDEEDDEADIDINELLQNDLIATLELLQYTDDRQ